MAPPLPKSVARKKRPYGRSELRSPANIYYYSLRGLSPTPFTNKQNHNLVSHFFLTQKFFAYFFTKKQVRGRNCLRTLKYRLLNVIRAKLNILPRVLTASISFRKRALRQSEQVQTRMRRNRFWERDYGYCCNRGCFCCAWELLPRGDWVPCPRFW